MPEKKIKPCECQKCNHAKRGAWDDGLLDCSATRRKIAVDPQFGCSLCTALEGKL